MLLWSLKAEGEIGEALDLDWGAEIGVLCCGLLHAVIAHKWIHSNEEGRRSAS